MNKNLKVCLFTNIIPPYYVSVFESLRDLVGGIRIFVSTPMEPNRNWKPEWGDLPVTVQKSWTHVASWQHEQGFSDRIWRHIPYDTLPLLVRHQPDVVISIQLGFRTLQAALYRKLFPKSRLIVWTGLSEHTEKGLPAWRTLQRKALLRLADAVLVNGASGTDYLLSLGVPREKIFPLPYCAKIAPYLELPLGREPDAARRLLYVGQLIERKGLTSFLIALSSWLQEHPDERCEFWIAGEGHLRPELERFPAPPQLQLRFLGSVAYEKLPQVYAQGGILVFPTLADEWGAVVNEALASGLPVLGSVYSQAMEELVQDGLNGWTFRPDHPEEMYAAVARAMSDEDKHLNEMRHASRERIRLLSPEYGAKCYLAAIDFVRLPRDERSSPTKAVSTSSEPTSKGGGVNSMVSCPFCRSQVSRRFELAHTIVWKCRAPDCGLQFADPQLDETDLVRAYTKHYYPSNGNGSVASYENTPEEILRQTFQEAHAKFGPLAGRKLLDFGCGVGKLCQIAREYGIQTTGIEADSCARQIAGKSGALRVHASLDELRATEPGARFEIITLWDVIEHLREPWKDLEALSALLQPGGWLLLSTPNANSLLALLQRERWENIVNPTHFYYFERRSLRLVLERAGFCGIAEWRFSIRYPRHTTVRRMVHRALFACRLQGQLLFVARPRMLEPGRTSHSHSASVGVAR